jgi:hypothetical protein
MYIILDGEVRAFSIQEDTGARCPYALFGGADVSDRRPLDPGRAPTPPALLGPAMVEIRPPDFLRLPRLYPRLASMAHRNWRASSATAAIATSCTPEILQKPRMRP